MVWQRLQRSAPPASEPVVAESTPAPEELATWDDPNGFSFQYPKSLKLNSHDEDTVNYAHIEFTSVGHPGSVIVWGKDLPAQAGTKAADAAAWVKGEKTIAGAPVLDTTMGGKSGKKVMVETPKKQIIAAVVDEGVVFYVEGNLEDSEYWTNVHFTISSTFEFTYNKPATNKSSAGTQEEYADEEEVIE